MRATRHGINQMQINFGVAHVLVHNAQTRREHDHRKSGRFNRTDGEIGIIDRREKRYSEEAGQTGTWLK